MSRLLTTLETPATEQAWEDITDNWEDISADWGG